MKNIFLITLIFCINLLKAYADEHSLATFATYNTDQEKGFGYGLTYQYKFSSSYFLESLYQSTNEIGITTNDSFIKGKIEHVSFGLGLTKNIFNNIQVNASTGASYISYSSNEVLIQEETLSPYLKLSVDYAITKRFSFNIGHYSHFASDALDVNHSALIGLKYTFGQQQSSVSSKHLASIEGLQKINVQLPSPISNENVIRRNVVSETKEITEKPAVEQVSEQASSALIIEKNVWVIQVGAFKTKAAAINVSSKWKSIKLTPSLTVNIHSINGLFKVTLGDSFNTKASAIEFVDSHTGLLAKDVYITTILRP